MLLLYDSHVNCSSNRATQESFRFNISVLRCVHRCSALVWGSRKVLLMHGQWYPMKKRRVSLRLSLVPKIKIFLKEVHCHQVSCRPFPSLRLVENIRALGRSTQPGHTTFDGLFQLVIDRSGSKRALQAKGGPYLLKPLYLIGRRNWSSSRSTTQVLRNGCDKLGCDAVSGAQWPSIVY